MSAFGSYRLGRPLGTAGCFERFEATGPSGPVAIERPLAAFAESPSFVDLFVSEARNATQLAHPHVLRIVDVGVVDGIPYVATEASGGIELDRLLYRAPGRRLDPSQVASLGCDLAQALDAAHFRHHGPSILHRAVVPENIYVGLDGRTKLARFGVSRALSQEQVSRSGALSAQLRYAAPEYAETGSYAIPCDLYSLGVVLYECLTGEHPYEADNAIAMADRASRGDHRPIFEYAPETPGPLVEVCHRLIQPGPTSRPESAAEVTAILEPLATTAGHHGLAALVQGRPVASGLASGHASESSAPRSGPPPLAMPIGPASLDARGPLGLASGSPPGAPQPPASPAPGGGFQVMSRTQVLPAARIDPPATSHGGPPGMAPPGLAPPPVDHLLGVLLSTSPTDSESTGGPRARAAAFGEDDDVATTVRESPRAGNDEPSTALDPGLQARMQAIYGRPAPPMPTAREHASSGPPSGGPPLLDRLMPVNVASPHATLGVNDYPQTVMLDPRGGGAPAGIANPPRPGAIEKGPPVHPSGPPPLTPLPVPSAVGPGVAPPFRVGGPPPPAYLAGGPSPHDSRAAARTGFVMPTWALAVLGFFGVVLVLGSCVAMAIAVAALDR